MKTQAEDFHATYAFMRDSKRGAERAAIGDALETAQRRVDKLREEMADVDAAPGRIERPRDKPRQPPREIDLTPDARNKRLDFFKAQMAQLGGSMTIADAEPMVVREHIRTIEQKGLRPKAERDAVHAATFDKAANIAKMAAKARARAQVKVVASAEPDMFAVIDAFGNFPKFSERF